jgi:hypothetical protein
MTANRHRSVSITGATALLLAIAACSPAGNSKEGNIVPTEPASEVIARHAPELMAIPGVVGVYEGAAEDGSPVIGVLVLESHPEAAKKLPKTLEGYPVRVEKTDEIRPMGGDSTGG